MSTQRGRSKLADVLADIKNSRSDANQDVGPTPSKRRLAVNYVALSGITPRQSRSNTNSSSGNALSNHSTSKAQSNVQKRTYILKLFDRSVDLSPFANESTERDVPLYPICRGWVHGTGMNQQQAHQLSNQPHTYPHQQDQNQCVPQNTERSIKLENNSQPIPPDVLLESVLEVTNLPKPKSKLEVAKQYELNIDSEDIDLRIPQAVREYRAPEKVEEMIDNSIDTLGHHECLDADKQRWRQVKKCWSDARRIHESRYEESFRILDQMFMNAQRSVQQSNQ